MEKGTYGYIKRYEKKQMISVIILWILIVLGVSLSIGLYDTTKTLIILLPILTSLPFAKQLVGLILCIGFHPLSKEDHQRIIDEITYSDQEDIIYDISISKYEGILYFPAVVVRDGRLLFLYQDKWNKKIPTKDALKKHLKAVFENDKQQYVIMVTTDVSEFIMKAKQIKAPSDEFKQKDTRMKERIFELGI